MSSKTLQADLAAAIKELPPILTLSEAAEFMRLSTRTLRRLIAAGRLQTTKADSSRNGKVLVPRASIQRVLSGEG
ncbi:MAG: helix-turn-helix domain-containing protein [Planctomycetes bacterium]|nr:helix-turn-helix domain-containing protein [Planctomycetota bacterium]